MPPTIKSDFEVVRRNKVYEEVAKQLERLILKNSSPATNFLRNANSLKCWE